MNTGKQKFSTGDMFLQLAEGHYMRHVGWDENVYIRLEDGFNDIINQDGERTSIVTRYYEIDGWEYFVPEIPNGFYRNKKHSDVLVFHKNGYFSLFSGDWFTTYYVKHETFLEEYTLIKASDKLEGFEVKHTASVYEKEV